MEARGWLDDWIEDEDDDFESDEFAEAKADLASSNASFKDWTIKDLENFEKRDKNDFIIQPKSGQSSSQGGNNRLLNTKIKNMRNKMQDQLDQAMLIKTNVPAPASPSLASK